MTFSILARQSAPSPWCLMAAEDITGKIQQVHADAHYGIESARQRCFPSSVRVLDWAHLIAANRVKAGGSAHETSSETSQGAESDFLEKWRKGILQNVSRWLRDEKHEQMIRNIVFTSHVCTQNLFHFLWAGLVSYLEDNGEQNCARLLLKYYTNNVPTKLDCSWRVAPDRIQPGSGSGSQCQESWHGHRLKGRLQPHRHQLGGFVALLQKFVGTRAHQMSGQASKLHDTPCVVWDHCLMEGPLSKFGRTCGKEFVEHKAMLKWQDTDGTIYFMMRKSICKFLGMLSEFEAQIMMLSWKM